MPPDETLRVTTKDIARTLGLNPSTVSRALRNHPQIAASTKASVRAAARRLGYREDASLKSLISYRWTPRKRANLTPIALILENLPPGDFHPGELEAVERGKRRAAEMGYAVETFSLAGYPGPAELSKVLYHRGIVGILIGRTTRNHAPERFFFDWNKFAVVAVDAGTTAFLCHNVLANHVCAVGRLLRTLRARGFRRIGAVLRNDHARRLHSHEIGAYSYGQLELPASERIPICDAAPRSNPDRIVRWVRRHRPEVVISRQEETIDVLRSAGLRVPGDLHFAALEVLDARSGIAGFEYVKSCYAEAVIQLDALLRHNLLGLPPARGVHLIDPPWRPGATLPGIRTLRA
ncbi:MAG: LacI family DNA-binding transcriptional regulator [Terrimicrobiaceae bacterium]